MWFLLGALLGAGISIALAVMIIKEEFVNVTEHNGEKVVVLGGVMYVLKPALVQQSPGT